MVGPWARSNGNTTFLDEFFIDRGFAVLHPNFRGSTGYGDNYMQQGFLQWGEKMQEDVIDGLDWMIEQGIADPQKVCFHGGSYGGYSALVAAYKTPEKFKCAISFAGVTDLPDLRKNWMFFQFGDFVRARLPRGEKLLENSPLHNVDKIKLPLLIVHGDVDRSVMIEQGRNFAKALEEAGKDYQYIEQTNGDHYFSLQSHRLEYLQAMDEFLDKHIGSVE